MQCTRVYLWLVSIDIKAGKRGAVGYSFLDNGLDSILIHILPRRSLIKIEYSACCYSDYQWYTAPRLSPIMERVCTPTVWDILLYAVKKPSRFVQLTYACCLSSYAPARDTLPPYKQ